ncbi:MAG: gamma-glutamyl-gamma-aminobutyrate hydrolase family protein [Elusimicrobia bacterium]|nr:gamma-glutamyl-gamma-aminobutyrate hydrolase family protein [Elusimicrobiota bacterium]
MSKPAPLIGITCEVLRNRQDPSGCNLLCDHRYAAAVRRAGGHPVLLPFSLSPPILRRYLEGIDGLVIIGGDDVDPKLYGEAPRRRTHVIFAKRAAFETWLYREGRKRALPIFGICYGMQLVNVLEGGTLHQHLYPRKKNRKVNHRGAGRNFHRVRLMEGTRLRRLLTVARASVAAEHHQAVKRLGRGFVAAARAEDGTIEAIEHPEIPELLAVQWHPERRPASLPTRRLFRRFVLDCAHYRDR